MQVEKAAFPEPECSRETTRRWLEHEFGASVMVIPDAPGHHYPPHHHDCHEVIVGKEGGIVFRAEGREADIGTSKVLYLLLRTIQHATVTP